MTNEQKELFYIKVANFEGFRSRPYRCPSNVLTIGFGHTDGVKITDKVTLQEAKELLKQDFAKVFSQLASCNFILQEHELFAIADFVFNLGFTAFKKSSLFYLLTTYSNAIDKMNFEYATTLQSQIVSKLQEFRFYHDKSGIKRESLGLVERRRFESYLFVTGLVYQKNNAPLKPSV